MALGPVPRGSTGGEGDLRDAECWRERDSRVLGLPRVQGFQFANLSWLLRGRCSHGSRAMLYRTEGCVPIFSRCHSLVRMPHQGDRQGPPVYPPSGWSSSTHSRPPEPPLSSDSTDWPSAHGIAVPPTSASVGPRSMLDTKAAVEPCTTPAPEKKSGKRPASGTFLSGNPCQPQAMPLSDVITQTAGRPRRDCASRNDPTISSTVSSDRQMSSNGKPDGCLA